MNLRERRRQLGGLQNLRGIRGRMCQTAWQRARTELETLNQTLHDTECALQALEAERVALFEQHRGMTHRSGLFTLRRRASELEMRRVNLSLTRVQLQMDIAEATRAESEARSAASNAQRQCDKLTHIAALWKHESKIHVQLHEDDNV